MNLPPHPGLAKVRRVPLTRTRTVELLETCGARARDLLARGSVLSEGESVEVGAEHTYYGTTSVLLSADAVGLSVEMLEALALFDPHLRTHLLRLTASEVAVRLGSLPIGPLRSEIRVEVRGPSVMFTVDVAVPLLPRRALQGGA